MHILILFYLTCCVKWLWVDWKVLFKFIFHFYYMCWVPSVFTLHIFLKKQNNDKRGDTKPEYLLSGTSRKRNQSTQSSTNLKVTAHKNLKSKKMAVFLCPWQDFTWQRWYFICLQRLFWIKSRFEKQMCANSPTQLCSPASTRCGKEVWWIVFVCSYVKAALSHYWPLEGRNTHNHFWYSLSRHITPWPSHWSPLYYHLSD